MPSESQPPVKFELRRPEVKLRVPKILDPSAQSDIFLSDDGIRLPLADFTNDNAQLWEKSIGSYWYVLCICMFILHAVQKARTYDFFVL
jgi:hypothetical protein